MLIGKSSDASSPTKAADDMSPDFFAALERAQYIHEDCKRSLKMASSSGGQQTTAVEVMDQMASYQEAGLQRLYKWTQSQCRLLAAGGLDPASVTGETGGGASSSLLARAMSQLQKQRPALFRYVLDDYCSARRACLVRAFIDALTVRLYPLRSDIESKCLKILVYRLAGREEHPDRLSSTPTTLRGTWETC